MSAWQVISQVESESCVQVTTHLSVHCDPSRALLGRPSFPILVEEVLQDQQCHSAGEKGVLSQNPWPVLWVTTDQLLWVTAQQLS
jgi:hypothetical protein